MDNRLFTLETTPIEIIEGDTVEIPYQVTTKNGGYVNLEEAIKKIEWRLNPYNCFGGEPLIKKAFIKDDPKAEGVVLSETSLDCFSVILNPDDTEGFAGLYTYQIIITNADEVVTRRVQGNIHVWQKI